MMTSAISIGRFVGCVLALFTVTAARGARAADTAEELVMKGLELRRQDQHERALELFQRAHAQEPSPMTLAQMGIAEQSLKRWTDAELHLAAALEQSTFPWIRKNRRFIEQALETVRRHVGELVVRGTPGAIIEVNGRKLGVLPLPSPLRVNEGNAEVRVTAPGRKPLVRAISIRPGSSVELDANLEAASATEGRRPAVTHIGAGVSDNVDGERRWPRGKIAGVALLAASVAALAGGVAFLVADGKGACERPAGAECDETYDTSVEGWALVGTGVAAGAIGGVLIYRSSRLHVSAGVHGRNLVVAGRF